MTQPPDRPQGLEPRQYAVLERVTVDELDAFSPTCTRCSDEIFPGDYQDPKTGHCIDCAGRSGSPLGWVAVGALIVTAALAIAFLGWLTAPREAAVPTTEATRDLSGLRDGASGPPLAGAPRAGTSGRPSPTGAIGAALVSGGLRGWATWCAPTPTHCQSWGDGAMVGAVPSFSFGDEPYPVQVCAFEGGQANCVLVTVTSYCACGDRRGEPTIIDLSPAAFRSLAPLRAGIVRVVVDHVQPGMTLPPTDVAP